MRLLALLLILNMTFLSAQNTLQLAKGQKSPQANLKDVSWMEGHWKGTAFGGVTEEIWSPPQGNSMMFVFRHLVEGKVTFYEVGHIREVNGSLVFELRHFDTNLHAWEEKNEVQQFKHIKTEGNRVYFDGFTFEKIDSGEINIYGLIKDKDGKAEEVTFNYRRQ